MGVFLQQVSDSYGDNVKYSSGAIHADPPGLDLAPSHLQR